jgi:dTDP-4-amino-4,6-dideoxygalactose transaminase
MDDTRRDDEMIERIRQTWKIPLNKPYIDIQEHVAVGDVLKSGMLSQGEVVEEFEEKVRRYVGAKYAVAVSSCTAGLYLALRNLVDLWDCDVAIPAFTFPATQCCVKHFGGEMGITHVDVRGDTYNINTYDLRRVFGRCSLNLGSAIIPIHQFGLPCEMDGVNKIADETDAMVIQDAACAMGSTYKREPIGKHGTAVFSFHGRKIITTGEGGMIVTDYDELYDQLIEGRQFGRNSLGEFRGEGLNFKMSDLAAAVGCVQMEKLPEILRERAKVASIYKDLLGKNTSIKMPEYIEGMNWQSYVVRLMDEDTRDKAMSQMRDHGIEVQVGSFDNSGGICSMSKELSKTTLALPIWPGMTEEMIGTVAGDLYDTTKVQQV